MTAYALTLSEAKRVSTRFGPRDLRTSAPTEEFWAAWRADRTALKTAGWAVSRDANNSGWQVCLWAPLPEEETQAAAETVVASHAADAPVDFDVAAPDGLEYLPYQRAGIKFAAERPATLIGDEMGLGKTIQAIGVANATGARDILIVCPASIKLNWERELHKWLVADLTVGVAVAKQELPETNVVVINYDILGRYDLAARTWDLLVLDECHRLKNPKAARTKTALAIPARRTLALSGTPIVNRPIELQPILGRLDPVAFGKFFPFAKRYANAHKTRWGWDFTGASHLDELQEKLRGSVLIRRLKRDVLAELPAKRRQVIGIPANGLSDVLKAETLATDKTEEEIAKLVALVELSKASEDAADYDEAVSKLRAAQQVAFEAMARIRHDTAVAKAPYVIEHVQEAIAEGHKIVVFAHHHDVVDQFVEAFGEQAVVLTGKTKNADRQVAVDRFQTDDSVRVFIGGIQAAGVGITLTASSHVVFAELDWVPGNIQQAEDRCHRIGQESSVLVQHVVVDGSLDQRLASTIIAKQAVIDSALDIEHPARVEPVFTVAPTEVKRDQLAGEAEGIDALQRSLIHTALQQLAGNDADRAAVRNDIGFNGSDGRVGHSLAEAPCLTPRQAALGKLVIRKYRRQLTASLYDSIYGTIERPPLVNT